VSRWFGAGRGRVDDTRWIVLDVESSGLDPRRDRLLAIAAVALEMRGEHAPRIALADSFEAVLRHEGVPTDKDNILVHGIGRAEQRAGRMAAPVLEAFERWAGDAPLIAFHAAFDQTLIARAARDALGRELRNPWLDLEPVAAALHPGVTARALDDWLAHFRIDCQPRHQAAADALATAELLLRIWPAARAQRGTSFAAWQRWARDAAWLRRG
jgi:DNA polymerase-3 subunit epsilon